MVRTMDFVLTLLELFAACFIVLCVLNFLAKLFFPAFTFVLDTVCNALGRGLLLIFFTFASSIFLFGIIFWNRALIAVSIIALFLVWMYAEQNSKTAIQEDGASSTLSHRNSSGFSKFLAGLGLGYFVFGNNDTGSTYSPYDDFSDDDPGNDFCHEDIDTDSDFSDDYADDFSDD